MSPGAQNTRCGRGGGLDDDGENISTHPHWTRDQQISIVPGGRRSARCSKEKVGGHTARSRRGWTQSVRRFILQSKQTDAARDIARSSPAGAAEASIRRQESTAGRLPRQAERTSSDSHTSGSGDSNAANFATRHAAVLRFHIVPEYQAYQVDWSLRT
ncbi:hypothetical protein K466DRAFT_32301 [Polyporus arcularius HHB13444]|uniref:Uncharacterized protein n=1 Tax=Polyporus arcularius HHB13444 TaxID=1314778 RepID=A0A5C3NPF4_9APHY|nr:hypothetical protein K466DRAFT_32301 [Polyporus arcularius HHB13444]